MSKDEYGKYIRGVIDNILDDLPDSGREIDFNRKFFAKLRHIEEECYGK